MPRNLSVGIVGYLVTLIVGIFLTPFIIDRVGRESYGLFALAMMVLGYFSVFATSIFNTTSQRMTELVSNGTENEVSDLFLSIRSAHAALVLATIPPMVLVLFFLDVLFVIPAELLDSARWLFALVFAFFLVRTLMTPLSLVPFAHNRLDVLGIANTGDTVVRATAVIMLLGLVSGDVVLLGVAYGLGIACWVAVNMVFAARQGLSTALWAFSSPLAAMRSFADVSGWVLLTQIGTILLLSVDLLIVNHFFGAGLTGTYAALLVVVTLLRGAGQTIAAMFTPNIYALVQSELPGKAAEYVERSCFILGVAFCLPLGILVGLSDLFLGLWLGHEFSQWGGLLSLMILPMIFNVTTFPLFAVTVGTKKVALPAITTLSGGIIHIVLSIALVSYTELGVYAIALVFLVIMLLKNAIHLPVYCARILRMKPFGLFAPLLWAFTFFGFGMMMTHLIVQLSGIDTVLGMIGVIGIVSLLYGCLAFFCVVLIRKESWMTYMNLFR